MCLLKIYFPDVQNHLAVEEIFSPKLPQLLGKVYLSNETHNKLISLLSLLYHLKMSPT